MTDRIDFDLDTDVSDVADLINFINPVPGRHVYTFAYVGEDTIGKDEKASIGIRIIYQKIATLEKSDENGPDTPNCSVFSEIFSGNEQGKKFLKARIKQVFGDDVSGPFRPYIEQMQENVQQVQLVLTTSISKSSKDGTTYENVRINDIEVLDPPVDLPANYEPFEYEPKFD